LSEYLFILQQLLIELIPLIRKVRLQLMKLRIFHISLAKQPNPLTN
jgi:hypothetical protein